MLVPAIIAVVILVIPVLYVAARKYSVTRQEIAFDSPQDSVAAIYLDIREDTVRGLCIRFADGSVSEVTRLSPA